MHAELSNLWLFAQCLGKVSYTTGFLPGILIVYAVEAWRKRAYGVPARTQGERWRVWSTTITAKSILARSGIRAVRFAARPRRKRQTTLPCLETLVPYSQPKQ